MQLSDGLEVRCATQGGESCSLVDVTDAVDQFREGKRLVWINMVVTDVEAASLFLEDQLGFHRLAIEDAFSENERPTLQEHEQYLSFAIPAPIGEPHKASHVEVGFFLKKAALVTVSTAEVPVVQEWFDRWRARPKPFGGSPAMLMHAILDGIVDSYFPLVDQLEDELDDLAELVFGGDTTQVRSILELKKRMLDFRRRVAPVRDIVNALLRRDLALIPMKTKPFFQDVLDHVIRVSEILDMNRETLASLLDVHLSQVSNNLNTVVKKMTVVATVLMIMTVVSSIYGMNFRFMPELEWRYGYLWALGLMVGLASTALLIFKRIKWI